MVHKNLGFGIFRFQVRYTQLYNTLYPLKILTLEFAFISFFKESVGGKYQKPWDHLQ